MMAETEAEVFLKSCNLFKLGRIRECMKKLETLTFKKFGVLELGQENNILICRYVNKKFSTSTKESTPQQSVVQALETLHEKVQGIPLTPDNSDTQLLIAYNVCCLRLMSHDTSSDIKPDMTHDPHLGQTCHLLSTVMLAVFSKWLRLCRQKADSTNDEDSVVRNLISVLSDSKTAAVSSREEICLLLCLHSLTLVLEGRRSEAREHLEALSAIHFEPECLHIVSTSTDDRSELQLTEMMSSLLSLVYFSFRLWDKCRSVLTPRASVTPQPSIPAYAVYMHAYVLYQQQEMGHVVALLTSHTRDAENQFTCISLNLLGCCLSAQGKVYSAIEMLKRAALSDRCYPAPLYNMSLQYRKLGLYDAELETLNLLVAQLKNPDLSNKKRPTVEFYGDRVRLSSPLRPPRELEVTLAQATYTLCKRCLELQRYQDAASGYKTLLTLLHHSHMTDSTESCDLPGVSMATVYVETAYSLLSCGEFSDTVTVCQHLTGRSQSTVSMVTCDVKHTTAIMYEVYALVGLGDNDAALSALDMLIDLIAPTVTATMVVEDSPPPTKRSRSNRHPTDHHDMRHLLENAYTYKSVLLLRNNKTHASLTCSRHAVQLNTGEPEVMYNHTLLLLKLQRTTEACSVWLQYRGNTNSCPHLQKPSLHRKVPPSQRGSQLLRELDESALKDLDDVCMTLSREGSDDVDVVMDVT